MTMQRSVAWRSVSTVLCATEHFLAERTQRSNNEAFNEREVGERRFAYCWAGTGWETAFIKGHQ